MAQLVRRDFDIVLAGMISLIAGAVGQVLVQLIRGNQYADQIQYGYILVFANLALIAGLIVFAVGMFKLIRRVESKLYP